VRIQTARFWRRMPHELGRYPVTYYQTLIDGMNESLAASVVKTHDDSSEERSDVDVDELTSKGQRAGFGIT
jgi:hypothetical protein